MDYPTKTSSDYRAESDHRTLMDAAQIVADKVRLKAVLAQHDDECEKMDTMEDMLSMYRTRRNPRKGVIKVRRGHGPSNVSEIGAVGSGISTGVTSIEYRAG